MASFFAFAYLIGVLIVGPVMVAIVKERRDARRRRAWSEPRHYSSRSTR